ncbi:phosphohexomutase domain-containing protein [Kovacikia minuta]|uniref:hypothetical protein n=1 Tax=Kovacikia minuta TaxID=2931930 RepID=UPI0036F4267B
MVLSPAWTQKTPSPGSSAATGGSTSTKPPELFANLERSDEAVEKSSPGTAIVGSGWGGLDLPESRLFGTDGIRGRVGDLLTAPLALQLGFWAGQVLQTHATNSGPVVIGQDSRNSSGMLALALAAGLTAAGLEVWDLGLCPTPGVAHLTSQLGAIGGVMISASHNPPEDNGIKFFGPEGSKLSLVLQERIEAALRGKLPNQQVTGLDQCGQHYYRPELTQDYLAAIQKSLWVETLTENLPLQGIRVVLDLAWGAAVQLAPVAFRQLGAEVICLHDQADGTRINVNCGSTHLASLQAAVREHRADLGFALAWGCRSGAGSRFSGAGCRWRLYSLPVGAEATTGPAITRGYDRRNGYV